MDNKYFISDYMPGIQVRNVNKFMICNPSDFGIDCTPIYAGQLRRDRLIRKAQKRLLILNLIALVFIRVVMSLLAFVLWISPLVLMAHYGLRFSLLGIPVGLAIAISWLVIWDSTFWIQTDSDQIKIKRRRG